MAKTTAERQRAYRARRNADPEKREQYLRSERERWKRDTEAGKKKKISDLSDRAKQQKRKKWREAKKRQKDRKALRNISAPLQIPDDQQAERPRSGSSRRHLDDKKPSREEIYKLHQEIAELKQALKKERKLKEKYKKRLQRLAKRNESPRSKVHEPDKNCPVIHSIYVCDDYMLDVFDLKLKTS